MKSIANNKITTKKWLLVLLFVLFAFLYAIIFLLFFEGNVLHLEWMIAKNGKMWSGYVSNEDVLKWLNIHYHLNLSDDNLKKYISIYSDATILSYNSIYLLLGVIGFTLAVMFTLKYFKIINYDCFAFVITLLMTYISFLFSNLMPHWDKNNNVVWGITVLIITIAVCAISFIFFNKLFNNVLLKKDDKNIIARNFKEYEEENNDSTRDIKNALKKNNDEEVIEI
ncbi:MAG: hypothetical protein LBB95_02225 [Mycoplasmataceae bacterium]|nr:hypothetical protein [Mycoplasmataceae bacterium]